MRNTFAEVFYEEAKKNDKVAIVVADISPAGSMANFRAEFPERFVNVGVAEQVMIGLCAGMAHRGLRPFAYTIATFALYRPFEIWRDDLAYQKLPVTIVGIGGGVTYSTLGGTHHAMEDVAIATSVPNMQVVAPCDPREAADLTRWLIHDSDRPTYFRLGKAGEPVITDNAVDPFRPGKIRYLRKGGDVVLLSYGPTVAMVMEAADALESQGIKTSVVAVHSLKPLDRDGLAEAVASHDAVVVVEEHVPHGGLASRVKELAWDTRATCRLETVTLQDRFIHMFGSHPELLAAHGIDVPSIIAAAKGEPRPVASTA